MEEVFGLIFACVLGAIFGSYATLFAYRIPINQSCFGRYFGKKSACPKCNAIIKTRDLIPLINWIITLGRCRNCGSKIPRTHLFVELSVTILFTASYLKFSLSENFILLSMLFASVIVLITVFYTHKILPNSILCTILMLGLTNRVLLDGTIIPIVYSEVLAIIFCALVYKIAQKLNYNEIDDEIKLILVAGIILSIPQLCLYLAAVLASVLLSRFLKDHTIKYVSIASIIWCSLIF